ncbi:hypothetical protein BDV11DRAFT_199235 [Aspergillus similis]
MQEEFFILSIGFLCMFALSMMQLPFTTPILGYYKSLPCSKHVSDRWSKSSSRISRG